MAASLGCSAAAVDGWAFRSLALARAVSRSVFRNSTLDVASLVAVVTVVTVVGSVPFLAATVTKPMSILLASADIAIGKCGVIGCDGKCLIPEGCDPGCPDKVSWISQVVSRAQLTHCRYAAVPTARTMTVDRNQASLHRGPRIDQKAAAGKSTQRSRRPSFPVPNPPLSIMGQQLPRQSPVPPCSLPRCRVAVSKA